MVCPTPPMYLYLPPEYLDKLNDDNTEIVNPNQRGNVPQRKKRSSTEPATTLLGLLRDYMSGILEPTGNIKILN